MKRLGLLLFLPGWDTSPSQDTQHEVTRSIVVLLHPEWDGMLAHQKIPSVKSLRIITSPPGWVARPSQDTQCEVTKIITSPPPLPALPVGDSIAGLAK